MAKTRILIFPLLLTAMLFFGLTWPLNLFQSSALAEGPSIRLVATTGVDEGSCIKEPCATVQYAVDVADSGDEIKVAAGKYLGVQARSGITQTVYLSKTLTIQGGYTTTNWTTSSPQVNLTKLNAGGQGRVFFVTGTLTATIRGFSIVGGNAEGQKGGLYTEEGYDTGGGVYVNGSTVILHHNIFAENQAKYGAALLLRSSASHLEENRFRDNDAFFSGGGLFLFDSDGTIVINNSFHGNFAGSGGGAIGAEETEAEILENIFLDNYGASGGGVNFRDSDSLLQGNTFQNNSASAGGAIYLVDLVTTDGAKVIENVVFSNSASLGGGIATQYVLSPSTVISGNLIEENYAPTGGGAWFDASSPRVEENIFRGNSAQGQGGGIAIFEGAPVIVHNQILNNRARTGGGIGGDGGMTLLDNLISDNFAELSGGGLYFYDAWAQIERNLFKANQATKGGGMAIETQYFSNFFLSNNALVENSASEGAGLWIQGPAKITHLTVNQNQEGSAIYAQPSPFIPFPFPMIEITNTIISNHSQGLFVQDRTIVNLDRILWFNNETNYEGVGEINVTGEYTGNPRFAADGYHLTSGSQAIDQAIPSIASDIDGQARDLNPDLGADEYIRLLSSVMISGPSEGQIQHSYPFSATIEPPSMTKKVNLTWFPSPDTGQGTSQVTYLFTTGGSHTLTVMATSKSETVSNTFSIMINDHRLYLPLIER